MKNKQKLELTWIGKGEDPKLEPRILIEDPTKSYGDPNSENMLIHGDNLLALKSLEQDFTGKIKCIYIDPPYNTGSAFEHYDDNLEHSTWLNLLKPRIEILNKLLDERGILFISMDDEEYAYLKVLVDEIFGRKNYIGTLIWEKKKKPSFLSNFGSVTENILCYGKNKIMSPPLIYGETTKNKKYPFNNAGNGIKILTFPPKSVLFGLKDQKLLPQDMSEGKIITELLTEIEIKDGTNIEEFKLRGEWRYSQSKLDEILKNGETITISQIPFRPNHIKNGGEPKKIKNLLNISNYSIPTYEDATNESIKLFGGNSFDYPKPEELIFTLIKSVTNENDWILDSFLGSGTTASVSHKLRRKWIGIELGNHAETHSLLRMKKVIDGVDGLPLSEKLNWKGGGGFKFYNIAPSLLKKDSLGNWVIDERYNPIMLAAAMCKLMGFKFIPDTEIYWKQGQSTETDYIFTTTTYITLAEIDSIKSEMKSGESLLICAKSFDSAILNKYNNITIKKIPQAILGKCEFGNDNYDLNIIDEEKLNFIEDQDE